MFGFIMKKSDSMDRKLLYYINEALNDLYDFDSYLIRFNAGEAQEGHVGERAIVFRFGIYLQSYLAIDHDLMGFNLDCEYNRNGLGPKFLNNTGTYPDMILHKRGENDHNIMIIEFKSYWNNDQDYDTTKICGFTDANGEYKYTMGLTVLFGRERSETVIEAFQNGQSVGKFKINNLESFLKKMELEEALWDAQDLRKAQYNSERIKFYRDWLKDVDS